MDDAPNVEDPKGLEVLENLTSWDLEDIPKKNACSGHEAFNHKPK